MLLKQFVVNVALTLIPMAAASAYPNPVIYNRAPFAGLATISYNACRPDRLRLTAARANGKGVMQETVNRSNVRRAACLINRITVTLDGTTKTVTPFTSKATGDANFILAPLASGYGITSADQAKREVAKKH